MIKLKLNKYMTSTPDGGKTFSTGEDMSSLGWETIEILMLVPNGKRKDFNYIIRTPDGITLIDQESLEDEMAYEIYVDAQLSDSKLRAAQAKFKKNCLAHAKAKQ